MIKKTGIIAIVFFFLTSCGSEGEKKEESKNQPQKEVKENHNENDSKAEALRLDDGKKWIVNPETTLGVNKMVQRTDTFDLNSSSEAYQVLFDSLDADFRYIFIKCTTEGVAHDQLHIMLFPLRGMFNRLKSPEGHVRKEALENVKKQLSLYDQYFAS